MCKFPLSKATAVDKAKYESMERDSQENWYFSGVKGKRDDRTIRYGTRVLRFRRVWSRMGGWGERKSYVRSGAGTR